MTVSTKVSVSLPETDVLFVDRYAREHGGLTRSAAMHQAIEALREQGLAQQYAEAYDEWAGSEDAKLWDNTTGDGIA